MLNLNGVVVVENAQMIEEEEVEEEVPAAAAPTTAADQPMADAEAGKEAGEEAGAAADAAAGGDAAAAAADGQAPMAEDAAGAAAPQKVVKKKVKKHMVPFASHTAALSSEQLQKLYEVEVELALQVGVGRTIRRAGVGRIRGGTACTAAGVAVAGPACCPGLHHARLPVSASMMHLPHT